ncbi:MAG: Rne/Rng family ribonuclease [Alphaproteobacteria bacterium]|nr:Rne/Rng family ribonuclease [Alphaproteobacteria bacterium]
MSKLMLIDATHPEETRVAVVANGQIEDFDFEARDKRQLRGNIYLAKVTRVEPSLQAAFVDYGGNRHGFLAFSEIHPDYYQIPKEDRERLMAEAAEEEEGGADGSEDDEDDDEDESRRRAAIFLRKYKIQEVIRRRQVILIQVVKEERGNKGAAVTTYLSLAGRYCVLMPNTARGGGISRKITNAADRKRLKKITSEFEVPRGAGLIVRTAGAKRTKTEISRDFEYLTKLWQQIVSRTMDSMAPALIHEEGHLVLRAVRDLYDKDVEQIVVEGQEAYDEAKTFVKMLMPSHARKVVLHDGPPPLFVATGVEDQLENIFSPVVQLPSGGYIVINQTEALVAIDVNSGKATRERNIEATALKTNLEAASEACRQMRLRDLAGLIVIDFIDMEETKNNRAVEKRMKDSLKIDRARVQTGRISQFGLFEISRQRRRAGVLELSSEVCKHCGGTGRVRAIESAALQLLRMIEARAADDRVDTINVGAPPEVALYILNEKRASIAGIESSCHVSVRIEANATLKAGESEIEASADGEVVAYKPIKPIDYAKARPLPPPGEGDIVEEEIDDEELEDTADDDADDGETGEETLADDDDVDAPQSRDEESGRSSRRGRRGGRRRRGGRDGATPPGLEVIEPQDDNTREEAGGRSGRGRRRRGGRDDRQRARIPDIAADGGEMLDAIASAPFLPAPGEGGVPEGGLGAEAVVEVVGQPVGETEQPAAVEPAADDHEIAATEPEAAEAATPESDPDPEPETQPAPAVATEAAEPDQAEDEPALAEAPRQHALHGPIEEPAPAPEGTPRRFGWWSRKKAG